MAFWLQNDVLHAYAEPVQSPYIQLPPTAPDDRAAVKQLFNSSYQVYRRFAFGHDEVAPDSQTTLDPRNGWGATIVDGLSTMAIMGFDDLVEEAVGFISKIDFSKSNTSDTVSVFETTIRYVGGLISAYELTNYTHPILLQKAQEVADKLVYAWVGSNALPYGQLNFTSNTPIVQSSNIAEAGTLTVEFGALSRYTKNDTYINLALKSAEYIAKLPPPLPGLAPQCIDPTSGNFTCGYTWGGGSDSCYEYFAKYTRLFNPSSTLLMDTWFTGVDSSIKNLLKTSTVGDYTYLADYDDQKQIRHVGSHLACFYGGNWILGGAMLNNETIVNHGLELTDACWNTYASTTSGIGPEIFAYISSDGAYTGGGTPSPAQLAFYKQHGYYITAPDYILRPEVLESNFYAYRRTGNVQYYKNAQAAVKSLNNYIILKNGGAVGLNDVDQPSSGIIDETESFWFAEVLKYLYLTFDDPNNISLDTHVFNTESHPLKAPPAMSQYGSGKFVTYGQQFSPISGNGYTPPISASPGLPTPIQQILNQGI
ncbi:glycoside hydrolase family 47 protein [Amanita muscaria]